MTRRKMRKLKREDEAQSNGPQVIATGRISGGVSETYITFRSMPSVDQICSTAVRKVVRGLKHVDRSGSPVPR